MLFALSFQIIYETTNVDAHQDDGKFVVLVLLDPAIHQHHITDLNNLPQLDFHIYYMDGNIGDYQFLQLPFVQCRDPKDKSQFWIKIFDGAIGMSEFVLQFMKEVKNGDIEPIKVF
ncbi:Hypothetical_protein [Hexamita inflata]|uniref:Hypothetical_protein n=1 Tax=Hexamita inflata TaxID=28002 RepID=A0AA86QZ92_9EUKA|nr:Hypothetical protein HINF_LOCUS53727 [Hexamita inflata]